MELAASVKLLRNYFLATIFLITKVNDTMSTIFTSYAMIAAVDAVIVDQALPFSNDEACKDNGSHSWDKFVVYTKGVRSDEFYRLPCQFNRFFPP